jgi:hypothetical protein
MGGVRECFHVKGCSLLQCFSSVEAENGNWFQPILWPDVVEMGFHRSITTAVSAYKPSRWNFYCAVSVRRLGKSQSVSAVVLTYVPRNLSSSDDVPRDDKVVTLGVAEVDSVFPNRRRFIEEIPPCPAIAVRAKAGLP